MPRLELTELELKVMWMVLDEDAAIFADRELNEAFESAFEKVYRAYRNIPASPGTFPDAA